MSELWSWNHEKEEPSMTEAITIRIDLAMNVFQVHGVNADGAVVIRR